jgi:hypothetical protein
MPAPPSSPVDPALSHLLLLAADAAGEQIVRRRRISGKKKWSRETACAVTSLTDAQGQPG